MTTPLDDKQARRYLAAFADGELDVEQNLAVLDHMAMNPSATRRVMHQQQLRQLVGRSMTAGIAAAPASLRAAVERMPVHWPRETQPVLARIGRWAPAAVAALLLIATVVVTQTRPPVAVTDHGQTAGILSASLADRFARKHVRCSHQLTTLRNAALYPSNITELPAALAQRLESNSVLPGLDLSSIGYQFTQAGDCSIPGKASVHMIYRSAPDSGHTDTLSLWITPYAGQPAIEPDRLYHVNTETAPHPMLLWRHGQMMYYLVGDDPGATQRAAEHLQRSP